MYLVVYIRVLLSIPKNSDIFLASIFYSRKLRAGSTKRKYPMKHLIILLALAAPVAQAQTEHPVKIDIQDLTLNEFWELITDYCGPEAGEYTVQHPERRINYQQSNLSCKDMLALAKNMDEPGN